MTGRDNNVETDPALRGISEIDADTLRRAEMMDQIVEKSTVIAKELELMRQAYWQGVGQTPAPGPGSIVDKRNNLYPTAYNLLWREWIISVATDYFTRTTLHQWSTSAMIGPWRATCWLQHKN
jgi:hypothetical protein